MLATPAHGPKLTDLTSMRCCTCRGALQLASPEVKFEIDRETHDPLDVGMYQVSSLTALAVTHRRDACCSRVQLPLVAASRGLTTRLCFSSGLLYKRSKCPCLLYSPPAFSHKLC